MKPTKGAKMLFFAKIMQTLFLWFIISVVVELGVRTVAMVMPALKAVFTIGKSKLSFAK